MITASSAKLIRQDQNVVMTPPISGPIAAAIAMEAPTSAYTLARAAPSKLPWMRDCMAGRSREAPSPPMIAQKTMIAVTLCASVMATAPMAYAIRPMM